MNRLINQNGISLILALIFMVVLAIITGSYIFLVNQSMRLTVAQQDSAKAFYVAEAGLNKAVWYLTHTAPDGTGNGSWRTHGYPQIPGPDPHDAHEENFGDGSFIIWVEDSAGKVMISARGSVNDLTRTVRQEFSSLAPVSVVANSWKEIGS